MGLEAGAATGEDRAPDHHALLAGVGAAVVGFVGSFTIVLAGLRAVHATEREAASGLLALALTMGVLGIVLSVRARMPLSIAWSTPGAALLVTGAHAHLRFADAVGAFLVAAALTIAASASRRLARLVETIPPELGSAMLAGIVLELCLAPVEAAVRMPRLALPVVAVWIVADRLAPRFAVLAAAAAAAVVVALNEPLGAALQAGALPRLVVVAPRFATATVLGIGLPLFLVTMAGQNIPGRAVLASYGYEPAFRPLLGATGAASAAAAPFGGHAVSLAAITAALCAGDDAHPDPARRYLAAVAAGVIYLAFGAASGVLAIVGAATPPLLLETVAGLALLRTLGASLGALGSGRRRDAALATFVVTASGITIAGISAPFWGLVAGALLLVRGRRRPEAAPVVPTTEGA